jgi:hypothetical protein
MAGKLTDAHRRFVVTQLACFTPPTDVQTALKERHGIEISLSGILHYDPNTANGGAELAPKWRRLFEESRKRFSETLSDIPIAQQAWRLRELSRQYKTLDTRGEVEAAAAILEQAAKEVGGMFSNKRVLVGANDAPLIPDRPDRLTREEQDEQASDILDRALARRAASVRN